MGGVLSHFAPERSKRQVGGREVQNVNRAPLLPSSSSPAYRDRILRGMVLQRRNMIAALFHSTPLPTLSPCFFSRLLPREAGSLGEDPPPTHTHTYLVLHFPPACIEEEGQTIGGFVWCAGVYVAERKKGFSQSISHEGCRQEQCGKL